ncbi:MAG TPA: flagellar basal-body MS-ring/collar protein FliF [Gaiellaceae bacterium]|nr:flagellar basal-body MS-ring/collar protein FliF [Gaiellaceae bacterium]
MNGVARFKETWNGLETRGQVTLVGAALAVIVTMFFLYSFASRPSYTTLATGLDPARTGQAQKALDTAGISYTIANGGTEIDVLAGQESRARIALATKGVLGNGRVDFSIFDKSSLGATDFQQQVNYQRALEGEIATTIEAIQGVTSAQVQLVLPQDSLFASSQQNATAAVLISGGSNLDGQTVRGMAHLVASSVKGLDAQNVTITDETGSMLWPQTGGDTGTAASTKLQADQLYAAQLSSQINALLTTTLGAGKAVARVNADLNVDKTSIEQVTYAKKGSPLTQQTDQEKLTSKGGGAAVPSGTSVNTPNTSYPAVGSANSSSNYTHHTAQTTYGLAKKVLHTDVAPGSVRRLDVALLVDRSVPVAQVAQLQKSVASLAGVVPARGDTLAVSRITFAKQAPATVAGGSPLAFLQNPIGLVKGALAVLGSIVFLFFMRRALKRREGELAVAEPTWLRELEGSVPLRELEEAPATLALPPSELDGFKSELEEIARRSPEALALQVNQWMKE